MDSIFETIGELFGLLMVFFGISHLSHTNNLGYIIALGYLFAPFCFLWFLYHITHEPHPENCDYKDSERSQQYRK